MKLIVVTGAKSGMNYVLNAELIQTFEAGEIETEYENADGKLVKETCNGTVLYTNRRRSNGELFPYVLKETPAEIRILIMEARS